MTNATLTPARITLRGYQVKQLQAAIKGLIKVKYIINYVTFKSNQAILTDPINSIIFDLDDKTEQTFYISNDDIVSLKVKATDEITIALDNSQAIITIGNITKRVNVHYDANLVPEVPGLIVTKEITITQDYIQAINDAVMYALKDDNRPALQTILHNHNMILATNSHRLFKKDNTFNCDDEFLLEQSTAKLVNILFKKSDVSNVYMGIDVENKLIQYNDEFVMLISKLPDLVYPDMTNILKDNSEIEITFNRLDLIDILSQEAKNTLTILDILNDTMTIIVCKNNSRNQLLQSNLNINKRGNDLKIAIDTMYLLESLKQLKDDIVTCNMTSQVAPITLVDKQDNYHLILPIRLPK